MMTTETLDKAYLEYSNITNAVTAKEIALIQTIGMHQEEIERLKIENENLRLAKLSMSELLKFENIKEGDILVSPWGTEVEVMDICSQRWVDIYSAGENPSVIEDLDKYAFETCFGGWKVKEK